MYEGGHRQDTGEGSDLDDLESADRARKGQRVESTIIRTYLHTRAPRTLRTYLHTRAPGGIGPGTANKNGKLETIQENMAKTSVEFVV